MFGASEELPKRRRLLCDAGCVDRVQATREIGKRFELELAKDFNEHQQIAENGNSIGPVYKSSELTCNYGFRSHGATDDFQNFEQAFWVRLGVIVFRLYGAESAGCVGRVKFSRRNRWSKVDRLCHAGFSVTEVESDLRAAMF